MQSGQHSFFNAGVTGTGVFCRWKNDLENLAKALRRKDVADKAVSEHHADSLPDDDELIAACYLTVLDLMGVKSLADVHVAVRDGKGAPVAVNVGTGREVPLSQAKVVRVALFGWADDEVDDPNLSDARSFARKNEVPNLRGSDTAASYDSVAIPKYLEKPPPSRLLCRIYSTIEGHAEGFGERMLLGPQLNTKTTINYRLMPDAMVQAVLDALRTALPKLLLSEAIDQARKAVLYLDDASGLTGEGEADAFWLTSAGGTWTGGTAHMSWIPLRGALLFG